MVLQREKPITVWGDGKDGRRVTVTLAGYSASDTVRNGAWRVTLPPMPAASGLTMTIRSGAVVRTFRDIAVGEVWLCGGQSNMEFEIRNEKNGKALLESLRPECGVRFYAVPKQRSFDENFDRNERKSCWAAASAENAAAWSAVGLYYALELAQRLGVTVGLIGCNWGGTSASAWVSRDVLEQDPLLLPYLDDYAKATAGKTEAELNAAFDDYAAKQEAYWTKRIQLSEAHPEMTEAEKEAVLGPDYYPGPMGPKNEQRPCGLYETMLQRVCPYTLRGFLFYQGESDCFRASAYAHLLTGLITCWRRDWNDPALPFLNVQLPGYRDPDYPDSDGWAMLRQAQYEVYRNLRNTGLAVILDCGDPDDIHPADKAPVGHRLALQALYMVYNKLPASEANAPAYRAGYVSGKSVTVLIGGADEGFVLTGEPEGFALAGADGVYHPARAQFGRGQITLSADGVASPVSASYAWMNAPTVHVFGTNGLPLAPFKNKIAAR